MAGEKLELTKEEAVASPLCLTLTKMIGNNTKQHKLYKACLIKQRARTNFVREIVSKLEAC